MLPYIDGILPRFSVTLLPRVVVPSNAFPQDFCACDVAVTSRAGRVTSVVVRWKGGSVI